MTRSRNKRVGISAAKLEEALREKIDREAQNVPEFMRKHEVQGLENLEPTAFDFLSASGIKDSLEVVATEGYDLRPPIDYILLAMIYAQPDGSDALARLAKARIALGFEKGIDPREDADNPVLLDMGIHYLSLLQSLPKDTIPIQPIARECLANAKAKGNLIRRGEDASQIRRLSRKFRDNVDLILGRIALNEDPFRVVTLSEISKILDGMAALGIPVSQQHIAPAPLVKEGILQKKRPR